MLQGWKLNQKDYISTRFLHLETAEVMLVMLFAISPGCAPTRGFEREVNCPHCYTWSEVPYGPPEMSIP